MLRVGIIGCGDISNLNVLGYLHSKDTDLVAVCDDDVKRARKKLERWGLRTLKIYHDYKELIDHEDLDIIEILTPHHLHCPMTEYAAKAQIQGISVQKPMAHTITDCEKMIEVCKENNVILKNYENFRFYPPYLKAKELLSEGIIGDPLNFRINSIRFRGPSMHIDLKSLSWRRRFETCGGGPIVYDDGIHKYSIALWLMDQKRVEELYAWIDYFTVVMDIPSYIVWKYPQDNRDSPPKYGSMEFTFAPNLYYPSNYYVCDEFIEISGTKGIMWLNQCTAGGNFLSDTPQFPPIVVYVNGEVKAYGQDLPRDWRYSFINSTEHFINVVKNGGTPIYNGEEGKNLCIFAKMPYISNQRKRPVLWEEISAISESDNSCVVEEPHFEDRSGFTKFNRDLRNDLKKGIINGLINTEFKFQYEE